MVKISKIIRFYSRLIIANEIEFDSAKESFNKNRDFFQRLNHKRLNAYKLIKSAYLSLGISDGLFFKCVLENERIEFNSYRNEYIHGNKENIMKDYPGLKINEFYNFPERNTKFMESYFSKKLDPEKIKSRVGKLYSTYKTYNTKEDKIMPSHDGKTLRRGEEYWIELRRTLFMFVPLVVLKIDEFYKSNNIEYSNRDNGLIKFLKRNYRLHGINDFVTFLDMVSHLITDSDLLYTIKGCMENKYIKRFFDKYKNNEQCRNQLLKINNFFSNVERNIKSRGKTVINPYPDIEISDTDETMGGEPFTGTVSIF